MMNNTVEDIRARLDELTLAAKERMHACATDFVGVMGGAEICFMTQAELAERHSLVMQLPTAFEEMQAATARIQERIAQRKSRSSPVKSCVIH